MNKFMVFPCLKNSGDDDAEYSGPVITLACSSDVSFVLFFPVSKQNASIINFFLQSDKKSYDYNTNAVGVYKTIVDAWLAGDRYLSGILMDTVYTPDTEEELIAVKLIVAEQSGRVDSVVRVNFVHAVILAAMEKVEIIVSDEMLNKLVPSLMEDEEMDDPSDFLGDGSDDHPHASFPIDKNILAIAKKIMTGKIE